MNVVRTLYRRERGERLRWDYSVPLKRLICNDYDEFRGILPSTAGPDFNPEPPVFACTFCTTPKYGHLLALANEDGKIAIQNTNLRSDHNPFQGHQAHHNAIFDVAWSPGEMRLASASGDHMAVLWDVQQSGDLQLVSRFHAHTRSVKTVAFPPDDKMIFATGARDGYIMLWDTRSHRNQLSTKPDNFICNSHSAPGTPGTPSGNRRAAKSVPSRASSITSLVFQNNHTLISCGAGDGKVKVWDVRKSYSTYRREPQPKYCMSTPNGSGRSGFTCLALDPAGFMLYASCMDNTIYSYNVATYGEQPVGMFKGHKNATFYVRSCLSPDGRFLLSGSSDENAYIWDTQAQRGDVNLPIVKLVGHKAEVTCVAWCPVGEMKMVTCSDDARHCLWRVGSEFRGDNHQVELHGWAEEAEPPRAVPRTPRTPSTPASSFTSWRRWTPHAQRTPDNTVREAGSACSACSDCHRQCTPCLRCIATRAPLPVSVPHGSKKRLEVLWEEDGDCPECEREGEAGKAVLGQISGNVDALSRRLFSATKRRPEDEDQGEAASAASGRKRARMEQCGGQGRAPEPSPKKAATSLVRRTSPRKRCLPCDVGSPENTCRVNENAGCSKDTDPSPVSAKKMRARSPQKTENAFLETCSPTKKNRGSPVKRRISDRPTDSPHKRLAMNDDLLGIAKIEDGLPINPVSRVKRLCARHRGVGFTSPTLNLPNYVLDGTSPHHRCSPVRQHKENVDWLTQHRRERNSTEKRLESDNPSAQDAPQNSSKKTPWQTTPGKPSSSKVTPAKSSSRVTPSKSARRTTPAKNSSTRVTPAKTTSVQAAPSTPNKTGKKTSGRRSCNADSSGSSGGAATSLLKFFRVSEKPCPTSNVPNKSITAT